MAKAVENPKRFIVSCRVDDKEMRLLLTRASEDGVSISMLLRNCLDLAVNEQSCQRSTGENLSAN